MVSSVAIIKNTVMRQFNRTSALTGLSLSPLTIAPMAAFAQEALTNADVVKMVKAKLDDQIVITKVR